MLLKIVQGPNAGAEIALAEGMTVSLGKGDSCDIVLADQSLADIACELEVNAERVRMLLPGGAEERLEPFCVKFLGETTAIAVGPEASAWDELVWPTRGGVSTAEPDGEEPAASSSADSEAPESDVGASGRKRGCGCAVALILSVPVAAVLLFFLLWPFRSGISNLIGPAAVQVRPIAYIVHDAGSGACGFLCDLFKGFIPTDERDEACVPPPPDIRDVAARYGLSCMETNGTCILSGNFASRSQRLSATAEAYAAKPGVLIDLSDDESLWSATADVLELVSEGRLKVHSATNRILALSGFAPGAANLRMVLEAIRADVPHVRDVDCTRVKLGETNGMTEVPESVSGASVKGVKTARVRQDKRKSTAPKMPVVGVLTVPYPCLVLKDGSRVTEGAEFGGFIIDKIGVDTVRIKGPEGTFEWRP